MGMWVRTTLPISAGSMSTWMMVWAWGAKRETLPVTRSSKRRPMARITSAWWMARLAATVPCIPGIPSHKGWFPGKAPRPMRVVITGSPVFSAKARSSAWACCAPPPP